MEKASKFTLNTPQNTYNQLLVLVAKPRTELQIIKLKEENTVVIFLEVCFKKSDPDDHDMINQIDDQNSLSCHTLTPMIRMSST